MTTDPGPANPASTLRRAGIAVLGISVVVGVLTTVMLIVRAAPALSTGLLADSHSVPMDATLTLETGSWVVFEQTGVQRRTGPVTSRQNHAITLTPDQVEVTGPGGNAIRTVPIGSNQTITRNGTIYTGAVAFTARTAGPYRVVISGDAEGVLVSPSLGSTFSSLAGWFLLGALAAVGCVAGLAMVAVSRRRPATVGLAVHSTGLPRSGGAPPGWYPDPGHPGQRLWWDGARWHLPQD